ncbi:MAG: cation-transporting P-type ATPase, partial [Ignavibacteriaceae bacterium]|nr:cation-transporting P-type ATPase [Ignavibacteriaceae bacterium]
MENETLKTEDLKKLSVEESFKKFSSSEKGISDATANDRIKEYGYNEISEKKVNPI